jgi:predicted ATPase/transcriptional regulator with XRE-family HTH domain
MGRSPGRSLGSLLRQFRQAAGLSQEQLAERAGLTAKAIGALERGERRHPYPQTLQALAQALGLADAERQALFGAVHRREGTAEPAPQPATPAALPPTPMPLLGRAADAAAVTQLLLQAPGRLLTITGPGGVGKTRLAIHVSAGLAEHFPGGVVFVELAPLADGALVLASLAAALEIRATAGQSLETLLQRRLAAPTLIVLDNIEHLLEAVPAIAALLASCASLRLLATSRVRLHLTGEQEYPLAPLALPRLDTLPDRTTAAASPAVQLFVQHAQAVAPGFALTETNAPTITAICRRLDGLPLALSLAAARVKLLGLTGLLARLDRALPLLSGGPRDLPARQQTMRAAIGWSYELLNTAEQALFRQLGVFAGGWTLDAAEAVCAGNEADMLLDVLNALVDHSLVVVDTEGDEPRYRLLETIRAYALEQLATHGELAPLHARHAAYYLQLAEHAYGQFRGPDQVRWLERLEQEQANLRAVMAWALDAAPEIAARLSWALWLFWWIRGYPEEGHRATEQVLARVLPPEQRVLALAAATGMAYMRGEFELCARYAEENVVLARQVGDMTRLGHALVGLGLVAIQDDNHAAAAGYLQEALDPVRQAGDGQTLSTIYAHLGTVARKQGDLTRASERYGEALRLAREIGDRAATSVALANLALVAQAQADWRAGAQYLVEGVVLAEQMGDRANLAHCLEGFAVVAGQCGRDQDAAQLFGASRALLEAVGATVYSYYQPDRQLIKETLERVRARLGEPAWAAAEAEGRTRSIAQLVAQARQLADDMAHSSRTRNA